MKIKENYFERIKIGSESFQRNLKKESMVILGGMFETMSSFMSSITAGGYTSQKLKR